MAGPTNLPENVGRYEIRQAIGHGAMGRVLLAHDPVLDRDVAIKMLRSDLDIGPEVRDGLLRRMRHEARAAARVAHPNIVTLHDMIDDDRLGVCLVFEVVEGKTLKDRIAEGPLPPAEVAMIARQIGGALALAHAHGVLHRDIKPENIMLARHGAKITDFGIARVPDSTLTRAGGLLGTPAYSAPECISGNNFSDKSDQFSLAATLYEAASGRRAFPGDDAVTVAARIGTEQPPPFAAELGLSPRVDEILARALSKKPEMRYPDCSSFANALAAALETARDAEAATTMVDPVPPAHSAPTRPIAPWASVAVGGAFIGALCAIVLVSVMRPSPPAAFDIAVSRSGLQAPSADTPALAAAPVPTPGRRSRSDGRNAAVEQDRDANAGGNTATDLGDGGVVPPPDGAASDGSARPDAMNDAATTGDAHDDGGQ